MGDHYSIRYQHQSNASALRAPYRAENTIRDTVDQDWFGPVLANEPMSTTTFAGSLRPLTPSPHMHKHVHVDRSHVENHQSHAPSLAMVLDVMPLGMYAQRPHGSATPTSTSLVATHKGAQPRHSEGTERTYHAFISDSSIDISRTCMVTVGLGPPKVDDLETSMVESDSGSCSRSSGEPNGLATISDRVERCRTIEPRYPRGIDGSNSSYPTTLQQYFQASGEGPMDQVTLTHGTYIGVDVHRLDGSNEPGHNRRRDPSMSKNLGTRLASPSTLQWTQWRRQSSVRVDQLCWS